MVEEFRWLIDGMVLGLVNRGVVHHDDFACRDDYGCRMAAQARKKFYGQYEDRIRSETSYREIHISYRRILFHQAEHLARVIQGEDAQYLPHLIQ
jgi:CRISPR/Cas system-associated endonuclease Cas1